jgi:cytosol alanyl aminopeptidase
MLRALLFFVICAATKASLPAPPTFLLPNDVLPKKHTIELTINPSLDTFVGWARIDVQLTKSAAVLWVNAKDLTPERASVDYKGHTIKAKATAVGEEFIGLELASAVGPGPATISIHYHGKLDEKLVVGPYRNKIGDDWYAFTTFTPIDARRAFPCFDEPRFKTPWETAIRIRNTDRAFSNARQVSEAPEPNGMKLVRFAPTAPLPAEVVALAVGPFEVYEGAPAGHGTAIRIIVPKGLRDEAKAAAQATVDALPRLEAYTAMPYPYGKLDHVAVPEFKFGAVENPGLITYVSKALLTMPGDNEIEKARRIRGIQSHEMAHQWFGDLVTQAVWDDVWLSEGFATWLSAKVMDEEQPQARKLLSSIGRREGIMLLDGSPKTRPVRLEMHGRKDMDGVYSQFVYQKGAAMLVMLDGWLGEERVRDSLREYLKAHRFGNATTADLEASIEGSKPVLDSFLNQTGVPSVRGTLRCAGDSARLALDQTNASHDWTMPVCWRGDGVAASCAVLDRPHAEVKLPSCPAWVYLNSGGTGYYRTVWSSEQLAVLDAEKLTAAERLTLVYDLRAERAILSPVLKMLSDDHEPEIAKAAAEAMAGK